MSTTETALRMPDILRAIFKQCTSGSLAASAAVSKHWFEHASNALWRDLQALWPLLQLLGDMEDSDEVGLAFTRPVAQKNWTRFLVYAPKVHSIDYDIETKPQRIVTISSFALLAVQRPQLTLLPHLHHLSWAIPPETPTGTSFTYMFLFLTPALKSLHLTFAAGAADAHPHALSNFRDFLAALPQRCPALTKLSLAFGVPALALEPALSNSLRDLKQLEDVSLPAYTVTTSVLLALAHHAHLRKIFVHPFWGSGPHGDVDDVKELTVDGADKDPRATSHPFPALKELDFDAKITGVHSLLSSPHIPRTLTRLYFSSFAEEPLHHLHSLLQFISTEFTELTLLGIAYLVRPVFDPDADLAPPPPPPPPLGLGLQDAHDADGDADFADHVPASSLPRITFDTIRPVLHLKKLSSFYILHNHPLTLSPSDIAELGAAWGSGPMRHLRLVPSPVHTSAPSANATTHTLQTLELFAEHMPLLEHLELYLDATQPTAGSRTGSPSGSLSTVASTNTPTPLPMPKHTFKNLHTLDIGTSPINPSDEGPVAQYLAKLIPSPSKLTILCEADWAISWANISLSDELDVLRPRRQAWRRAGEMRRELVVAVEEGTKRVRALEEGVRALEDEKTAREEKIRRLEEQIRAMHVQGQQQPEESEDATQT